MSDAVFIQQASGPCERLLRATEAHHAARCERWGIRYETIFGRVDGSPLPRWDKIFALAQRCETAEPGTLLIVGDADVLIEGDENLARALPARGADVGMVKSVFGYWNSGMIWVRVSAPAAQFWRRICDLGEPLPGITFGDQQRLLTELPRSGLTVAALNARWNFYEHARGPRGPVQVRAWHGPRPAELKLGEMRAALAALGRRYAAQTV
jgi:hypothetical protein